MSNTDNHSGLGEWIAYFLMLALAGWTGWALFVAIAKHAGVR